MTKLPKFKGRPLIEIPLVTPQIGLLEGDFGKAFLEEYKERVKTDFNENPILNVLKYEDAGGGNYVLGMLRHNGVVKGSNPFAVVLANKILRQEGLRTANLNDLEKARRIGAIYPEARGCYNDTILVLTAENDSVLENNPLEKNLGEQLKKRGIKFDLENPAVIPLTELELLTSSNHYGLTFELRKEGNLNLEHKIKKIGLRPPSGLSTFHLYGYLDTDSYSPVLSFSNDYGRIVVVKEGGTQ